MSFFADLQARGLVEQVSDPSLGALLDAGDLTAYCGFDPTGPSLHVGSLLQIVGLMRLQRAGHRPIALVGGATGMIGDPSGKTEERKLLTVDVLRENVAGIRAQLERFLDFSPGRALLVNNYDWFEGVRFIDFLRDVGKHFSVNMMLAKESVRARLEDREHGISYTEFSYMLLQSYDFLHLADAHDCRLQIGGTDQWGNITAGIDLVRRVRGKQVFGYTQPLVTTADGKKFGKTEAGTSVWLDAARTSAYQMFQYFLNADDRDAGRLLRYFTFLPAPRIAEIAAESGKAPEKRIAQRELAREVTRMVHGEAETAKAEETAASLFGGAADVRAIAANAPRTPFPKSELDDGIPVIKLLTASRLAPSVSAARRDIEGGGVYVNEERIARIDHKVGPGDLKDGRFVLLRKGKKNYHVIEFA